METRRQTDSFPTFILFYYKSCRFVVEKFEGAYKNREAKGKGEKERYTYLGRLLGEDSFELRPEG